MARVREAQLTLATLFTPALFCIGSLKKKKKFNKTSIHHIDVSMKNKLHLWLFNKVITNTRSSNIRSVLDNLWTCIQSLITSPHPTYSTKTNTNQSVQHQHALTSINGIIIRTTINGAMEVWQNISLIRFYVLKNDIISTIKINVVRSNYFNIVVVVTCIKGLFTTFIYECGCLQFVSIILHFYNLS